jgi:hypothetical protein
MMKAKARKWFEATLELDREKKNEVGGSKLSSNAVAGKRLKDASLPHRVRA